MENRKNKIIAFLKRYCITIWIVIVSVTLIMTGTLATYKYQQYAKLVARNASGGGIQFSSDILKQEDYSENILVYDNNNVRYNNISSSTTTTVEFKICNYPQDSVSYYSHSDIYYDLYAMVVTTDDIEIDGKCNIKKSGDTESKNITTNGNQPIYTNEKLDKMKLNTFNTYVITVDSEIAENVKIIVEARPTNESLATVSNKMLCKQFVFVKYDTINTEWSGAFEESDENTYWGYNYLISGSYETEIVLVWNSNKISLSDLSKSSIDAKDLSDDLSAYLTNGFSAVQFSAGANETTSYELQFYLTEESDNTKPDDNWVSVYTLSDFSSKYKPNMDNNKGDENNEENTENIDVE